MEVIVPTKLEDNFVLQNGSKGSSIQEAFKFNIDKVSFHPLHGEGPPMHNTIITRAFKWAWLFIAYVLHR